MVRAPGTGAGAGAGSGAGAGAGAGAGSGVGTAADGTHATRYASSVMFFFIELKPSESVAGQKSAGSPVYSTWKTALPASMNGFSALHWLLRTHSSLSAQSNTVTKEATWLRSFLRPIDSP